MLSSLSHAVLTVYSSRTSVAFIDAHAQQLLDAANGSRQTADIFLFACTRLSSETKRRFAELPSRRAGIRKVSATILRLTWKISCNLFSRIEQYRREDVVLVTT